MAIDKKKELWRLVRFGIVGCLNTLLTAVVIWILMRFFSAHYTTANFWGYAAGILNSFVWSKLWVFKARNTNLWKEIGLFGGVCLASYGLQLLAVMGLVEIACLDEYVSQLCGMAVYTAISFLLNRLFTFAPKPSPGPDTTG